MSRSTLRVIKFGGSLLSLDDLVPKLRTWLASHPSGVNVIVPGGGAAADLVRDADERFGLGAEASHWLAVVAMSFTGRILCSLLPEVTLVEGPQRIRDATDGALLIVDAEHFLRGAASRFSARQLPHGWNVTSDSIAANIAEAVEADELVLLKSCLPVDCQSWQQAADCGYVDRFFPSAIAEIPVVRAVNLRDENPTEWIARVGRAGQTLRV